MNGLMICQPNIKLNPEEPLSNSRLYISLTTNRTNPIKFHTTWFRIDPKSSQKQLIHNEGNEFYECSILDYGYIIQVMIQYQDINGIKTIKIAQWPIVKLNLELQQIKLYIIQPICCRMQVEELIVDIKILPKKQYLVLFLGINKFQLAVQRRKIEIKSTQGFSVQLNQKISEFMAFLSSISKCVTVKKCIFTFGKRDDRDLVLMNVLQTSRDSNSSFNLSINSMKYSIPKKQQLNQLSRNGMNKSWSVKKIKQQKIKQSTEKIKRKYNYQSQNKQPIETGNRNQSKQYQQQKQHQSKQSQLTSIDLRDSFLQLQGHHTNSKNSKLQGHHTNSEHDYSKNSKSELQKQNMILRQQNLKLKAQLECISEITKENILLKKKYGRLFQQAKQLQLERKQILEDKLKFQSNYYKELKEKQLYKKQYVSLTQIIPSTNHPDKSLSPYNKYTIQRPTPQRLQPSQRPATPQNIQTDHNQTNNIYRY